MRTSIAGQAVRPTLSHTAVLLLLLCALSTWQGALAKEYGYGPVLEGRKSLSDHFDAEALPNLKLKTQCTLTGLNCHKVVVDENGGVIHHFHKNDSVNAVARNRYRDKALLLLNRHRKQGESSSTDSLLFASDSGQNEWVDHNTTGVGALAHAIAPDHSILTLERDGLLRNGNMLARAPAHLESGVIHNNAAGTLHAVAISKAGTLYWTDLNQWYDTGITVPPQSDRYRVLGYYPVDDQLGYGVLYQYRSAYNKGLRLFRIQDKRVGGTHGWLFNSEDRNIGFNPEVYADNGTIYVSADNSTERSAVHFTLEEEAFTQLVASSPDYDHESVFSAMSLTAGMSYAYLDWLASSGVDQGGSHELDVDYEIARSLYKGLHLQGKVYDFQIAMNYLQSSSEKEKGLTQRQSRLLSLFVDTNKLFNSRQSLRVSYQQADINGIALVDNAQQTTTTFNTKYARYDVLNMGERGAYFGLQYSFFRMPTAVGFSDSDKNIVASVYDPDMRIKQLLVIFGYDELHYAKRYETRLKRFYWATRLGAGLGHLSLSPAAKQVAAATGKSLNTPLTFIVNGALDLGYILQQRFKAAQGLGYIITAGYRFDGQIMFAGQDTESEEKIDSDELEVEMDREDLWHGPFASVSLIF